MTPITDRACTELSDGCPCGHTECHADAAILVETARELEEMCEELARCAIEGDTNGMLFALARYQQLKEKAK